MNIYDANIPENITGVLETYRVRPEGMSLADWYMSQGEIKPPASEIPSGPPSSWGTAVQPVSTYNQQTIAYDVQQPVFEDAIRTVEDIIQSKGFVQGEYGGWYKPDTQDTRPIAGPVKTNRLSDGSTQQTGGNGNGSGNGGNGGNGETGLDIGPIILLLGIALASG